MSPKVPFPPQVDPRLRAAWNRINQLLGQLPQADKVRVTVDDDAAQYLSEKVIAGANVTVTVTNPGGIEQIEIAATGGGGAFTAGGDLTGTSTEQTVSAIQGVATPTLAQAAEGEFMRVSGAITAFVSPRSIVADGSDVWVGDHNSGGVAGSGFVTRVDGSSGVVVAAIDLAVIVPAIDTEGIRDMAQDASYVYCACWESGQIAIVDKATNVVAGWASILPLTAGRRRAISLCSDGAGKIFVVGLDDDGNEAIWRFDVASCLGQPPDSVGPELALAQTYGPRKVRYASAKLWLANGGKGDPNCLHRADPATLADDGLFGAGVSADFGMDCVFAFGSVWVTDANNSALYRVDPATMAQQAAIPTPITDFGVPNCIGVGPDSAGNPDQRLLIDCVQDYSDLWVIDPNTNTIEATVNIGNDGGEQIASIGSEWFVTSGLPAGPSIAVYKVLTGSGYAASVLAAFSLNYAPIDSLQGQPVDSAIPGIGDFLGWSGSDWSPMSPPVTTAVVMAGDVTGGSGACTVVRIQNRNVLSTAPALGNVMTWNGAAWAPVAPSGGGLPAGTLDGDLVTYDLQTTTWGSQQPPAGLQNLVCGQSIGVGSLIVVEPDRTGATTQALAYNMSLQGEWGGFDLDSNVSRWRASGAPMLTGVYEYDACALDHRVAVICWVEGGTDVHVRPLEVNYTPASGTYSKALGVDTTIHTGTAISNVSCTQISSTKWVVGWIDGGLATTRVCEYQGIGAAPIFGTPVDIVPGATDIISLDMDQIVDRVSTNYFFIASVGRSTSNRGYIATGFVSSTAGSNVPLWTLSATSDYFGGTQINPMCLTVRYLQTAERSGVRQKYAGVLYGDSTRGVDAQVSEDTSSAWDHWFGNLSGGFAPGTEWPRDLDVIFGAPNSIVAPAVVDLKPGFGDIMDDGRWVEMVASMTFGAQYTVILTGMFNNITPTPDKPRILPFRRTDQWAPRSVMVRRLGRRTFAWGAVTEYSPNLNVGLTRQQILFGVGKLGADGEVSVTLGSDPCGNDSAGITWLPTGTQEYQKFIPLRMSDTRFLAIGSTQGNNVSPFDFSWAALCRTDEREVFFGIAQEAGALGTTRRVVTSGGISRIHTGLIPGRTYYLGLVGGSSSQLTTDPSPYPVGVALSATDLYLFTTDQAGRFQRP